jgi:hypothetical protein
MHARPALAALPLAVASCAPLLDADFDAVSQGLYEDAIIDLPGPPDGDRVIVANLANVAAEPDGTGRALFIFRNVIVGSSANHGEAYFDPLPAGGDRPIFFSWSGEIIGSPSPGTDAPLVAVKLRGLVGPDQPNLFSKLTFRYGPTTITEEPAGGIETAIGFSVTGPHAVILRLDPDGSYAFAINGEGVSPGGGFTHAGNLPPDTVDPSNIGVTITFAESIDAAGQQYRVDDMFVSDRGNR